MLCGLLRLMSRLIPLVLLLRLLLPIMLVPRLILLFKEKSECTYAAADAAADTAVVAADARAADLADAAADVAAAVDSAGDLYRRACRVRRHCGLHVPRSAVASGFEASDQGMVAIGPIRSPVELLHANETTLHFG